MNNIKLIAGIWNGMYTYNFEELMRESIQFTMNLAVDDGEISGQCYDSVEDGDTPVPSNIWGFVEGNIVRLTRKSPYQIYIDETGEFRKDETQIPTVIHYLGEIIGRRVKGTWEMKISSFEYGDEIILKNITGKWEMKKQMFYWA